MSTFYTSRFIPLTLLALMATSAGYCQFAQADILEDVGVATKPALYEFFYRIKGSEEDKTILKPKIEDAKRYFESREIPENIDGQYIHYKATQDKDYLQKILQSQAYFDAEVKLEYEDSPQKRATFTLIPGKRYYFSKIRIDSTPQDSVTPEALNLPENTTLRAAKDKPAVASYVYDDQKAIEQWVEDNNCLFTHKVEHRAIINHLTHTVDITYQVLYAQKSNFGEVDFSGNDNVSEEYLRHYVSVTHGDCFTRTKLEKLKTSINGTGLFNTIEAQIPDKPGADGSVPVKMQVTPGEYHTIKAGASYSTDIGPGFKLGWEHRNFLGSGEKFNANLTLTPLERRIDTKLKKPFFWDIDQNLTLGATIFQKDNEAYQSDGFELSANIDRKFGKWTAAGGVAYNIEHIKDQNGEEDVALLQVPISASRDERNNVLNPTEGWTLNLKSTPAFDTIDINSTFIKNQGSGTIYQSLDSAEDFILAGRLAAGGIWGSSTDAVPATERFYVGGANSIRGYAYQSGGPLDSQNDPLGGRSYIEFSTELRARFADDYGAVIFVDGGDVYETSYPDFSGDMLLGGGLGLRYFTAFGPVRADIAFPLNRRKYIDDPFQLYFSIGQSF